MIDYNTIMMVCMDIQSLLFFEKYLRFKQINISILIHMLMCKKKKAKG